MQKNEKVINLQSLFLQGNNLCATDSCTCSPYSSDDDMFRVTQRILRYYHRDKLMLKLDTIELLHSLYG